MHLLRELRHTAFICVCAPTFLVRQCGSPPCARDALEILCSFLCILNVSASSVLLALESVRRC